MEEYKKIITAHDGAVSFLPKKITSHFGNAHKICNKLCANFKNILIICTDQAYFALGKRVKDELISNQKEVSCFCFDSEIVSASVIKKIIEDEENAECVLVVGEDILLSNVLSASTKQTIIMPLNLEFGGLLQDQKLCDFNIVFDDDVFNSLSKNRVLSGVKSVLSKNILFIESAVNELIGGLLCENEYISLLKQANESLTSFISLRKIKHLIKAQLYSSLATGSLPVQNEAFNCAYNLNDLQGIAEFGEREYMFYQMLIKIYSLYLENDTAFLVKLPSAIEYFEKPVKGEDKKPLDFLFDEQKLAKFKQTLCQNEDVKKLVKQQLNKIESNEQLFYSIYAGRKYTVQNYNAKERIKALKTAPLMGEKTSLFKLIWADGVLEYI